MITNLSDMESASNSDFHQVILLDTDGFIFDSCDSVFDTSDFRNSNIKEYFPFWASEMENILASQADKLTFSQVHTDLECLPGFYDYTFSKKKIEGKTYILWEVYDYTSVYTEYVQVQQIKNELDIEKQFIAYQKDLQHIKNAHSSQFFQTEYIAKQKSKNEASIRQLIDNKYANLTPLTGNDDHSKLDLHFLRGHLELLINEIDLFLEQTKEVHKHTVELKTFINSVFQTNDSLNQELPQLVIEFNESVPSHGLISKKVLKQILTLMCVSDTSDPVSVDRKLSVHCVKSENEILLLKFVERFSEIDNLNEFRTKHIIKLSILKSLTATIGGDISSKNDDNALTFEAVIELPLK